MVLTHLKIILKVNSFRNIPIFFVSMILYFVLVILLFFSKTGLINITISSYAIF